MRHLLLSFFIIFCSIALHAQPTIGLIAHNAGSLDDGYVLFAPIGSTNTYLVDKCGNLIHTWPSTYRPGQSCYLLPDGSLLRTGNTNNTIFTSGGKGGIIEKIDWDGNVIWSYSISSAIECQHHDIKPMPNGNILVIAWEAKNANQAIINGRNPDLIGTTVWSEQILEIEPVGTDDGNIVWEWHLWDHLVQDFDSTKLNFDVVNTNPQLININYEASATNADWIHLNSIDYNEELDQILLSTHAMNEIWIIDHSTTTTEAAANTGGNAGKGGDILYRWGNPMAYNTGTTQNFFGQHNARWIESGFPNENQIMVFNNGNQRPGGNYSSVEIINPPISGFNYETALPYGPAAQTWIYNDGNIYNLFAQNISGAQPLSNGNILFTDGPKGTFIEINSSGTTLWEYVNPIGTMGNVINQGALPTQNQVFRSSFYPSNFIGFDNLTLTAGPTIEATNTVTSACVLVSDIAETAFVAPIEIYPNPTDDHFVISTTNSLESDLQVTIFDALGKSVLQTNIQKGAKNSTISTKMLNPGSYWVRITAQSQVSTTKVVVLR
jgi:Arylsulfotransferase (ASST)/Secretion system C-terminal sorting domain